MDFYYGRLGGQTFLLGQILTGWLALLHHGLHILIAAHGGLDLAATFFALGDGYLSLSEQGSKIPRP